MSGNRGGDQYLFRFPPGLRAQLQAKADQSGRNLSAELVAAIEKHLADADIFTDLRERVARIEQRLNL